MAQFATRVVAPAPQVGGRRTRRGANGKNQATRRNAAHTAALAQAPHTQTNHTNGYAATSIPSSREALMKLQAQAGTNRYAQEPKSSIIGIGLTIHNAPVELREKLAVPEQEWPRAIEEMCKYPHIDEAAILSTCNRLEIYSVALSFNRGVREIEEWLSSSSGVPLEELRPYLFLLKDKDATRHLLQVSSGLDSLVMGEGQILAQVKQVFKVGQECNGFGRQLSGLFKQAITCGKRVRSETNIASGAVSVSSAAAELAQLKLPTQDWETARVAIIGAGKMSRLLVKHLASKGCSEMTVVNRSAARVEELQNDFPDVTIQMKLMPDLMEVVGESDVIFAASGSESILIHKNDVEGMVTPPEAVGGLRRFVDISVPRNIDPAISELGNGKVYNVDDLKEVVEANKKQRAAAAAAAETLIFEEQDAFDAWRDSLETVPTIKRLRAKAEDIRQAELEKTLSKLGDNLTKKERRAVEDLSRGIVNKLLHGPMQALRSDATDASSIGETLENMYALERMFDLKEDFVFPGRK